MAGRTNVTTKPPCCCLNIAKNTKKCFRSSAEERRICTRNKERFVACLEEGKSVRMDTSSAWLICFTSFFAGFICFGIQCNFGLFLRILVSSLKVGTASTAWLGSLAFGVTFFSSPFSNALCESFRPSHVSLIGVLFCAFGLLLSSFASNILSLYLTYGLCFGVGSSMAYFPTVIALKKYFKRHLTLANGLSASGSGLGTLALGPLIEHCLDTVGLRLTYIVLSAVAASMLLTHIGFACAEGKIGAEDETAKLSHNLPGMGRFVKNLKALVLQKDLWKDGKYVFMVVSIAVFLFGYFVPYVHLVYLATTMGVPTMKATLLISYLSISSTVGKVFFGILINFTRIQVRAVTAISMLCIGLSNTLISHGTGYTSLCAYAVVIGLCEGCFTGQIATIVLETIGSKRMPSGLANLFAVNAVFMMAGPPFAGFIYDKTQSYSIAFSIAGGTGCTGALLMFLLSIFDGCYSSISTSFCKRFCDKDKESYLDFIRKPSPQVSGISDSTVNVDNFEIDFYISKETNV